MANRLFDWDGVSGVTLTPATVSMSGLSRTLALAALTVMLERWRWSAGDDFDAIEAAVSAAILEIADDS